MADCFISYSHHDQALADFVFSELRGHGVDTFMASASLSPGQQWSAETLGHLRSSRVVILLASRVACASVFVNQEIGGAVLASKKLIPVVWDMDPAELPGWASQVQAVDLRAPGIPNWAVLRTRVAELAVSMRQEQTQMLFIVGAVLFGLFVLSRNQ